MGSFSQGAVADFTTLLEQLVEAVPRPTATDRNDHLQPTTAARAAHVVDQSNERSPAPASRHPIVSRDGSVATTGAVGSKVSVFTDRLPQHEPKTRDRKMVGRS